MGECEGANQDAAFHRYKIALNTFSKMKDTDEPGGRQTRLFRHAVEWYRNGLIPRILVKRASYAYFRKCLLKDRANRHYAIS